MRLRMRARNHILIPILKLWEATLYPVNSVGVMGLPLRKNF
jgi:hypothetical protein